MKLRSQVLSQTGWLLVSFLVVGCAASQSGSKPDAFRLDEEGNRTQQGQPISLIRGLGKPGAYIKVTLDGVSLGQTRVGEDGKWVITQSMPPGTYEIVIVELDKSDEQINKFGPFELQVGQAKDQPKKESQEKPVEKQVQKESTEPQEPKSEVVITSDDAGAFIRMGARRLEGNGPAGVKLQFYLNGNFVGVTTAGQDGKWSHEIKFDNPGKAEVSILPRGGGRGAVLVLNVAP